MVIITAFLIGVSVFCLQMLLVAFAINAKLDWTDDKKLLLWYDEFENGVKVRKFITIIK